MFFKKIDFSKYSSIRVGQTEEVMILQRGDDIPKDRYLIGGANNLLVSTNPPPLMMLGKEFSTITQRENLLSIGAAVPTGKVISYARKHNLGGFEFLAKLPGMMGGLLAMNAGVKSYEIFNILHSVKIDGRWVLRDEIEYGYRFAKLSDIVTEARFEMREGFSQELLDELVTLRSNQPKEPSAGSVFKNPKDDYAGRLIEEVGLKGFQKGNMAWSNIHANFLINLGGGNFEDALYLIETAEKKIVESFDIKLHREIKIL